eukprot:08913_2
MPRSILCWSLLLLFLSIGLATALPLIPSEPSQRSVLRLSFTDAQQKAFAEALSIDVWSNSASFVEPMDAVFTVEGVQKLKEADISFEVLIPDLQGLINQQKKEREARKALPSASYYDDYHPLNEIEAYLRNLQAVNSDISSIFTLGNKTHEGRTLIGIKISMNGREKKSVWFHGGQHAREWISPSTVMYITEQLLTDIRTSPALAAIDWYILPVMNADGYSYTWTNDRMWRKNRRNNGATYGVDLNRNWDYQFGGVGSSGTPASDTYRGPFAFSEPESDAIARFIATIPNLRVFVDWHSYSQYILRPWAAKADNPVDESAMQILGDGMKAAMFRETGADYTSMHWYQMYF